ncbi:hypothetical protein HHK36_018677 [Tetracentron sinense]|uniref:Cytochrome P450 n=1 Tax=Tetracentron sinense TaxID=13715 RepID=A0A835DE88_TETSI|nr:hypothetical protein HHK36_018677 [Tetracentron sinense]
MKNNTLTINSSSPTLLWGMPSPTTTTTTTAALLLIFTTALLFLISTFFFILFRSQTWKKSKQAPLPPGPAPWPVIGNLPELLRNKPAFRWIIRLMKEMNTDIACIRLGNVNVIAVDNPEIAREILKKQDAVFASRPVTMATEYSTRGFLTTALVPWGEQWKKMRRVVASELINPARLRWLLHKRTEEADNLVRYIYNQCNSSHVIDVRASLRHYGAGVIKKMMFNRRYFGEGRKDGGPGVEEEEHVDALFTVLSLIYAFSVSDYIPCLRWFDLDGHERIIKEAIKIINKYHDPIIDERIHQWRNGKKKEPEDFLDLLISVQDTNGQPLLSTEEIKGQVTELMLATVDNPPNVAEWALAEMINQPTILQKAVEEIDSVVGKGRLVQESDIPRLNYVKACAKETLRMHPIAPFNLVHMSMSDTTLAGYFIPKGSHMLICRQGLNPKVWEEPLRFIPERHLKNKAAEVDLIDPDLRFIGFSTGRRGCMGVVLGTAMTIVLLARLLQGFTWSLPPNELSLDLTESKNDLALAKPLHLHAKPRLPVDLYPTTTY